MNQVKWTITVPEELDQSLRAYLTRQGKNENDLSRFVEDAVQQHLFEMTVQEVEQRSQQHSQ